MSNNTAGKGYQIGDYVDYDGTQPEVKVVSQIGSYGVRLKDPFTGQIDSMLHHFSRIKLFRTRTRARQNSTVGGLPKKPKLDLSKHQVICQQIKKVIEDPCLLSPRQIIQLLRGKHYFHVWALTTTRLIDEASYNMAIEYFKLHRTLFLRYMQTIDFQLYDPKSIYGNSLGALCSSHSQIVDALEMATGVSIDFHQFRRNNTQFFKKQEFERQVYEWLEGEFLPIFNDIKYGYFPSSLLIQMLVLLKKYYGKENSPAEPWVNVFQQLYRCFREQLEVELASSKELAYFLRSAPTIFKIIFDHKAGYLLLRTEDKTIVEKNTETVPEGEKITEENASSSSSIPVRKISRDERVRMEQIAFKGLVARSYLVQGNRDTGLKQLNSCLDDISRETKVREELLFKYQNWPVIARSLFQFFRKTDTLELVLKVDNYAGNLVSIRNFFVRLFVYIPKEMTIACINSGKSSLVKQILTQKPVKEGFIGFFTKFLSQIKVEADQVRELSQIVKFLENSLKGKQIDNVDSYREMLLRRQFDLAVNVSSRQFHIFQNLLAQEDDLRVRILSNHVHNVIIPKCEDLLVPFNEYILNKYVNRYEINVQTYQKILQPMLILEKNSIRYNQRKGTIMAVLLSAFKKIQTASQHYYDLLRKFMQYFLNPLHDKKQQINNWSERYVCPYSMNSMKNIMKYAPSDFCEEMLNKMSKMYFDLDIQLYHFMFCKFNLSQKRLTLEPISQGSIEKFEQVPLYFEPMIESLFYLPKHELAFQSQQIERFFRAANGVVKDRMLEMFLNQLIKHECSSTEACILFKTCKTRIFQSPTKNESLDHRVKFINLALKEKYQQYLDKYEQNSYRKTMVMQEKKIVFELKDGDTLKDIKCKLANKINKEPCQIVLFTFNEQPVEQEVQRKAFREAVNYFVKDQAEYRNIKMNSKIPDVSIGFRVVPLQSSIHQSLYLHTQQLIQYLPRSKIILEGIDFLAEDWNEFDKNGYIRGMFEKSLMEQELPEFYQHSPYLFNMMIDYFLWNKDQSELGKLNFCALLKMTELIEKRQNILQSLKIVYLVYVSGTFKNQYRRELLDCILFKDPEDLERTRLDQQLIYVQLLELVISVMEQTSQGALQFCFTTSQMHLVDQCFFALKQFKKYWKRVYLQSTYEERATIFENIEQRCRLYPQNMKQLGYLIEKTQNEQMIQLYEKGQERMARFLIEMNKRLRNIGQNQKICNILFINCLIFCEKGIQSNFMLSLEYLHFLLSVFYEYNLQISSFVYKQLSYRIKKESNSKVVLAFFIKQTDEQQWRYKNTLTSTRRLRNYQQKGCVGLINCQNTCYANSLFQQLFHIDQFTKELLAADWERKNNQQEDMLLQLKKIFIHLKEDREPYQNRAFYDSAFKTYDGLPVETSNQMDVDQFKNMLFDNLEGILPRNTFWMKLFGGCQENRIKCLECQNVSVNQETFDSIHLTIQNMSNLSESLKEHNKTIIFENQNAYSCDKCSKKVRAEKISNYKLLPPYLMFVLKRFQYRTNYGVRFKLNHHFEFPMGQFEWNSGQVYRLKGIISHVGCPDSGHYVSYVKIQYSWFEFNDHRVRQVSEEEVKQNSYGSLKSHQRDRLSEKTAYILFYEEVNSSKIKNCMDIDENIIGVEDELAKINQEDMMTKKERAYFSSHYMELVLTSAINHKTPDTLRWLYLTLLTIKFKTKQYSDKQVDLKIEQVTTALTHLIGTQCQFLWEENIAQRTFQALQTLTTPEYKIFIVTLMVDNCPSRSKIVEQYLDICLSNVYLFKVDQSPYWVFLYLMAKKYQWVGQYLHQGRCIGRIIDSVMFWQLKPDVRQQLKNSSEIPFEKNKAEISISKQQLRYHKWALLIHLLNRFGDILHEAEWNLINQVQTAHINRIFQQCKNLSTMHYISQYICWLIKKLGNDFSNKILFAIRDSLVQQKSDATRRYFFILKQILQIDDEARDARNQHAVTIFVKVFNATNANSILIDYNMEFVWLWFLKIAGANSVFRRKVQQSKGLFNFLVEKNYTSSGFCKGQRTNSFARTRHRLHRLPIPKLGSALAFHQKKVVKTLAILENKPYDYTQDTVRETIVVEQSLNTEMTFYKFNEIEQTFETFKAKWIYGDLIAYQNSNKEKYPMSHFTLKGDQRVTLDDLQAQRNQESANNVSQAKGEGQKGTEVTPIHLDSSNQTKKC